LHDYITQRLKINVVCKFFSTAAGRLSILPSRKNVKKTLILAFEETSSTVSWAPIAFQYWWGSVHLLGRGENRKRRKGKKGKVKRRIGERGEKRKRGIGEKKNRGKGE